MKPIGPLMAEHRVIERLLKKFALVHDRVVETGFVDYNFLNISVDFFTNYVDKFHHGKEEKILFKGLDQKPLSDEDRKMLLELIEEHERTRTVIEKLRKALRTRSQEETAVREIAGSMETLIKWYPVHIEKEDRRFFMPSMKYLSEREQALMVEQSREFDRNFMQQSYSALVTELEAA